MAMRVLIVEDDFFIAYDLKNQLEAAGLTVVGTAGTIPQATEIIENESVDIAVLDINLNGTSSLPIAQQLVLARKPFLFLSGNDATVLPPEFSKYQVHTKPVLIDQLVEQLNDLAGPAD